MDFNYIRRNSLFSPVQANTGINPRALSITPDMMNAGQEQEQLQSPLQAQNPSTLTDAYREMMAAQSGPSNQRYKDFLDEGMPQREDYKPTKMNRLSAILAGASDGIRDGGGQGYKTARNVLDEPYNNAVGEYKNKAARLEAGANLEDKETNNKVKTYRDWVTDQQNQRRDEIERGKLDESRRLNNGRLDNWKSEAASRETPEQRMNRALGVQKAANTGRLETGKALFDFEQPRRTADAIRVAGVKADNAGKLQDRKFDSIKDLKQYIADNVSPDKYEYKINKDGKLVGVNKSDPLDVVVTGIDTGKLSDADKAALNLKNAKELKATPGAGSTRTTTTKVSGNERTTTSTTTPTEGKPKTVTVRLSDGRVLPIPADKLEEAKRRDPKLVVQ